MWKTKEKGWTRKRSLWAEALSLLPTVIQPICILRRVSWWNSYSTHWRWQMVGSRTIWILSRSPYFQQETIYKVKLAGRKLINLGQLILHRLYQLMHWCNSRELQLRRHKEGFKHLCAIRFNHKMNITVGQLKVDYTISYCTALTDFRCSTPSPLTELAVCEFTKILHFEREQLYLVNDTLTRTNRPQVRV